MFIIVLADAIMLAMFCLLLWLLVKAGKYALSSFVAAIAKHAKGVVTAATAGSECCCQCQNPLLNQLYCTSSN